MALNRSDKSRILRRYFPGMTRNSEMSTEPSAIPRIFKIIATMDSSRTQAILDADMYSGPSKLGPIADAIRRNGRASKNDLDFNVVNVGKGAPRKGLSEF